MLTLTLPIASSLAVFAFVSSITPGPNNAMLLASGANFGFRASLPHAAGVLFGFLGLVAICGLGLGGVFKTYPVLHLALKWGGAAYLLWLAFKIGTAKGIGTKAAGARPMRFWEAVAFQAVNPKGWAMALGAVSTYVPPKPYLPNLIVAVLMFGIVGLPCTSTWAAFGVGLRRFLDRPAVLRAFNVTMALLLVASLFPLFAELGGKQ